MSNNTNTEQLGTEKVSKLLLRYTIPAIISTVAVILYDVTDTIFVGRAVGTIGIGALTVALPLMNILTAFAAIVGVGALSLISIKMGKGDKEAADFTLGNAMVLSIILGILLQTVGLVFLDKILFLFGASIDTIDHARIYMKIILYGSIISQVHMTLNSILRGAGYPVKSMRLMIVSVIANIILDALFIFGFKWGVAGAAWATVIAQLIAVIFEILHFCNKKYALRFRCNIYRLRPNIIKGIIQIGISPFFINISTSIMVIFINNALKNNGGDLYIAAYGIVNRITLVLFFIIFGINMGMQPIVGYNYGAGKFDRIKQVLRICIFSATIITTIGFLLGMIIPTQLVRAFTTDESLIQVTTHALRIFTLAFPVIGFQMIVSNLFQSMKMPHKSIFLSISRQLLFLIPLLYLLPSIWGVDGVWISIPVADVISTIIAAILLYMQMKKLKGSSLNTRSSIKTHRAIIVWLLLFVFITPTIAQHAHIAEHSCCEQSCSHENNEKDSPKHDCANCPICQFTFSLFIDIEPYKDSTIINSFGCRVSIFYQNIDTLPAIETHFTRGPPLFFPV